MAFGTPGVRDRIQAVAATYSAVPDPLTHWAGPRIEPKPPQRPEPLIFLTYGATAGTP